MPPNIHYSFFTVTKTLKQSRCPLMDDWITKKWFIYTMGYHSALRKDEILPFETIWMDLTSTMLSKINQIEKGKNHMISLICEILNRKNKQATQTNKLTDTGNNMVVTRGEWGWEEDEEGKGGQIYGDRRRLSFG